MEKGYTEGGGLKCVGWSVLAQFVSAPLSERLLYLFEIRIYWVKDTVSQQLHR